MAIAGQLAALGTGVCWACGSTLFTTAGRRMGSVVLNRLRLTVGALLLIGTLQVVKGAPWPFWAGTSQLEWLALSGLIGFVFGDSFSFRSMIILGAGRATLLSSLAPIFTALLAWPVLGETLGLGAVAGIALTLGGLAWVLSGRASEQPAHREGSVAVGVISGVLGALGQAVGFVISKIALRGGLDALSATVIRVSAAAVAVWIVAIFRSEVRRTFSALRDRVGAGAMLAGSVFGPFLGVTLSLLALKLTQAGVAASIIACYPVLTILLSARFHGDRITFRMMSGAVVAISGVVVLFLK